MTSASAPSGEQARRPPDPAVSGRQNRHALTPTKRLATAAERMRETNVDVLPVIEFGQVRGVITDRDLVVRAMVCGIDPQATRVGDYVSFTGSVAGGREVYGEVSDRFIDAGLELGGKDPAHVAEDASFDFAVENVVDGAFYNAGQSCCAVERIAPSHRRT